MNNLLTGGLGGTPRKSNFDKVLEVKRNFNAKKVGRFLVDVQTANAIVNVHAALSPVNRAKYERMVNADIRRGASIAWKLIR